MLQILRRAAPAALAALCLASMALAPTAALAAPLKWAPPVLVNPITVSVQPGNFQYWCHNPASDVRLVWPSTRHVGFVTVANCHNIVSIGGWTTLPVTADKSNNAPSRGFYASADTGVVHIEGLLIDASGGGMSDGIDINAPAATVQIENVRIDGIFGFNDQFHADCVQPFGGVKVLRIDHMTCNTGYQGLSIGDMPASPHPWTADIENVNIATIGAAIYGAHNDGGYIYWPCGTPACANVAVTTLANVYLSPRPGQAFAQTVYGARPGQTAHTAAVAAGAPATISFPGLPITGHVTQGPPPAGDYVKAGLAGPAYVSPGYGAAP